MHVTHVDGIRGYNEAMHASVRRGREERRARREAEGVVQAPRRRAGRPRRAVAEDESQPQADLDYEQMDVEH